MPEVKRLSKSVVWQPLSRNQAACRLADFLRPAEMRYSPNQPRDSAGRFSGGGQPSGTGHGIGAAVRINAVGHKNHGRTGQIVAGSYVVRFDNGDLASHDASQLVPAHGILKKAAIGAGKIALDVGQQAALSYLTSARSMDIRSEQRAIHAREMRDWLKWDQEHPDRDHGDKGGTGRVGYGSALKSANAATMEAARVGNPVVEAGHAATSAQHSAAANAHRLAAKAHSIASKLAGNKKVARYHQGLKKFHELLASDHEAKSAGMRSMPFDMERRRDRLRLLELGAYR